MEIVMKKIVFLWIAFTSVSSHAATLLTCTTPGDALSEVKVVENSKRVSSLVITLMDGTTQKMKVLSGSTRLKKGSSSTLIASRNPEAVVGGEIQNAAMLQVMPGLKKANLSFRGSVFFLNCGL
jgi:hypothetical protein